MKSIPKMSLHGGKRVTHPEYLCNDPLSIITVVKNGEKTIERCIRSVMQQGDRSIEHIIIDGGSTDRTLEIIKTYQKYISLWISEADSGIYNALNKGISYVRGSYYIPLGADDELLPDGHRLLLEECDENVLAVMGKVKYVDKKNKIRNVHGHSAGSIINIKAHKTYGLYDEKYKIAADTKFLQMLNIDNKLKKINYVVGKFYLGGISSNYKASIKEHGLAMYESKAWGVIKLLLWVLPRLFISLFRK